MLMFTSCVVTGGMHDERKGTREKRQMLMWACRLRIRLACRWGIIYVRGRALIKKNSTESRTHDVHFAHQA